MNKVQPDLSWAGLCRDCENATIREYESGSRSVVCTVQFYSARDIHSRVSVCNEYRKKIGADLSTMKEIAWTLLTDKKNKVGFHPPKPKDPVDDDDE